MPNYLKNIRGQTVGWTRDTSNGVQSAYNRNGQLVGWFRTNQTYDKRGRLVTTAGDATSHLILEDEEDD